jgi:Na+-transporting methylmalonyl-CoA/oxaloacetate decarboxylase gamma subunit
VNRALTAGLVLAGVAIVGVVLGLLLVAPSGRTPPVSSTPPPPVRTSVSAPPDAVDTASVKVLADAIVAAISRHDSAAFGKLTCRPQSAEALAGLQRTWDAAGDVTATLPKPPELRGESATAVVHVEAAGGTKDTPFPLHKESGKWCVPG